MHPVAARQNLDGPMLPLYLPGPVRRETCPSAWVKEKPGGPSKTEQGWGSWGWTPGQCAQGVVGAWKDVMNWKRAKLWILVTIFLTVMPTMKVLSFLFVLENTTEPDEEFGKRVWVPCAESSDEICEQGKNKGSWLWRVLLLPFSLPNPLLKC